MRPELCDAAVAAVLQDEDTVRGGFGAAPKFPPSALLEALLRHHERTGSAHALATAERTATAMARGGIYDQLAGGFARYSVDDSWVVPHFEKMLYDNALLLRFYAHWARRTGDPLAHRIAGETARFLVDDLGADRMFTSSLDADADGVEGLTYAWTPTQLRDVLGEDDGRWAATLFAVTATGTFEHGTSVLQLPVDPDDHARYERVRTALLAARSHRLQPGRDDKVVTAWNGLAITALAEAAVALERPELLGAATECARAVVGLHLVDGRLRRASLGGRVGRARRSSRTTPRWRPGCSPCTRRPETTGGCTRALPWSTSRSRISPTRSATGTGSTPPTTPKRSCCGPPIPSTARRRRAHR